MVNADHEQFQFSIFCAQGYCSGALNTWQDPSLFVQLPLTVSEAHQHLQTVVSKRVLKRYSWRVRKQFTLPYGFVFLSERKTLSKVVRSSVTFAGIQARCRKQFRVP